VKYQVYLQFKIAPEIGSLGTKFSDLGLCFLENQPKIPPFLPPSGQQRLPPRIQAGSRPGAAARAAVRGCAWWRVVARAQSPWLRPGVQRKRGRGIWVGKIRVQVDLGLGRKKIQRRRIISLSDLNVGVGGYFWIKALYFKLFAKWYIPQVATWPKLGPRWS